MYLLLPPVVGTHEISSLYFRNWFKEIFPFVREEKRGSFLVHPQHFFPEKEQAKVL